ncbi:DUF4118 domain-containing protein [Dactylosporangium sp. McL0621]|uniref:ATP-binding protein n=1 Tax=Dactylosporangium sp. McL0621 TaxID=3415678 RepID=UPI003CF3BDA3
MDSGSLSRLVRPTPPPRWLGIAVAALLIVVETLLVYPLWAVMTPFFPGLMYIVIYIVGVLVASLVWGMWLGMATAVASTVAFVFFHVLPVGRFVVFDMRQIVGLAVLLIVGVSTSAVADLSRLRTVQAEESDLNAEMARLLLHADDPPAVLPPVAQRIAPRSPVPVELDLHAGPRMPPVVEVAAYHVVSEALTNAARHAHATVVHMQAATRDETLHLSIHDDGVGGADPNRGAGLTGLRDRVEALGGHLTITSPAGGGTLLSATIPCAPA